MFSGELDARLSMQGVRRHDLVFGIKSNVKRSWHGARREAGLDGLRFHDLRHTAATRLVQGGLPLAEVARILGHSQISTTYRYVNADCLTLSVQRRSGTEGLLMADQTVRFALLNIVATVGDARLAVNVWPSEDRAYANRELDLI